ncbi:MAG: cyanophycin synthetase [bacterium]
MKKIYFIGIKGVGMTSLALAMQDVGWTVEGSDTGESFITDEILSSRSLEVRPLSAKIPKGTDLIVYSAAYSPPQTSIRTISLAEALADFVHDKKVIAVAGVGGKTTTTAMLAALFHAADRDVGYYVGTGSISGLKAPGAAGSDPYFIVEADEYAISKTDKRPKFALLHPQILITTNIVHDHPDIYPDDSATRAAFSDLIHTLPPDGTWICNPSDPLTSIILQKSPPDCHIIKYDSSLPSIELQVFGSQNQLDAHAAVLAAIAADVPKEAAIRSIRAYAGAGRRQEYHGEIDGRLLYDDYGHHPQEIEITVKSFKEHFPTRHLILVFESHTYSRTEALLPEFAKALSLADLTFIMPIFESAREKGQPHSVTPSTFASMIPGATPLTWENAAKTIWDASKPGNLILTMGAGFVYKLHQQWEKLGDPARSDLEGSAQPDHNQTGRKV